MGLELVRGLDRDLDRDGPRADDPKLPEEPVNTLPVPTTLISDISVPKEWLINQTNANPLIHINL